MAVPGGVAVLDDTVTVIMSMSCTGVLPLGCMLRSGCCVGHVDMEHAHRHVMQRSLLQRRHDLEVTEKVGLCAHLCHYRSSHV